MFWEAGKIRRLKREVDGERRLKENETQSSILKRQNRKIWK